ncbi:5-formyltetrahydrofolate cyclo-ligase [Actibacterium sp. 188UL27-1]|uniref:5-formyltetrahydrofolate cyclo-ligase n=1 Tax=Actibacterium sp. 188UL27-1 TaxID=2786961 RepID=UPI001956D76E|nr:5-formyltetrahydrofolate cyclo-ligase [Actibacterium sp. 188UL27-1]
MTTAEQKSAARKAAFIRRKAAHRLGDHTGHLRELIGAVQGKVIAGYMPIRTEIDPLPAMAALSLTNRIAVPVIQGAGQALVFHEWMPGAEMIAGPFGAQIPQDGRPLVPDLLIVPLVAFEARCYRLGYGGGFYDRTLEGLRARDTVRAYGFAYAAQLVETLPLEPTDQPLDAIATDAGILQPPDA